MTLDFDGLVHSLYDVALGGQDWQEPLLGIARVMGADNTHLMVWDPSEPAPAYSQTWGMDEAMETQYRAHYGKLDPRRLIVAGMHAGEWFACHHRFDQRTVDRNEFWQDYLIRGGCRWLLGARLTRIDGVDVFFGMHRELGRRPFGDDELRLVQRLTPHFQRAMSGWWRLKDLRLQARSGIAALEALDQAVFALDGDARLLYADRVGEVLLRQATSLSVKHGRLTAVGRIDGARWRDALARSRATGWPVSIGIGAGDSSCFVTLNPMPGRQPGPIADGSVRWLAFATSPQRCRAPTALQLMQWFGLTPAEAKLATAIAGGESVQSYAAGASLALSTVRTQLRAALGKTGTSRQAEMVRLLQALPPSLQPNG